MLSLVFSRLHVYPILCPFCFFSVYVLCLFCIHSTSNCICSVPVLVPFSCCVLHVCFYCRLPLSCIVHALLQMIKIWYKIGVHVFWSWSCHLHSKSHSPQMSEVQAQQQSSQQSSSSSSMSSVTTTSTTAADRSSLSSAPSTSTASSSTSTGETQSSEKQDQDTTKVNNQFLIF